MLCVFGERERKHVGRQGEEKRGKEGARRKGGRCRGGQREGAPAADGGWGGVQEPPQLSAAGWKAAPSTHTLEQAWRRLWRRYHCTKLQHLDGLCSVSSLSYLRVSCVQRGRFPSLPTCHKRTVTLSPPSDLPDEKRLGATKAKLVY